eukprot:CAMPEP_0172522658 /NCGR_PEP_ID=MMETSP1066-20121228/293249_1 /TAXON_ID=671091 /ORGANISM="Coscinodiscus wailesii, Strain CCMP2513" /LENGTH=137 /DNA_ID=CAMNT_0013305685 /DNA_START=136 /DNA_END=549 /DNA_ORIENTATION=+
MKIICLINIFAIILSCASALGLERLRGIGTFQHDEINNFESMEDEEYWIRELHYSGGCGKAGKKGGCGKAGKKGGGYGKAGKKGWYYDDDYYGYYGKKGGHYGKKGGYYSYDYSGSHYGKKGGSYGGKGGGKSTYYY